MTVNFLAVTKQSYFVGTLVHTQIYLRRVTNSLLALPCSSFSIHVNHGTMLSCITVSSNL